MKKKSIKIKYQYREKSHQRTYLTALKSESQPPGSRGRNSLPTVQGKTLLSAHTWAPCQGSCIQWLFPASVHGSWLILKSSSSSRRPPPAGWDLCCNHAAVQVLLPHPALFLPKSIVQWAPGIEIFSEWVTREIQPTSVAAKLTETTDSKMGVCG